MNVPDEHRKTFRTQLLSWFDVNRRSLPWRKVKDSYHIWLSEVMLQQTRVDQARPYYERFVEAFPTVESLAAANLDTVLRKWEGLGYYARARNLHKTAKALVTDYGGAVPADYEALRKLPGIGPYTAGAIASIAFGLPHPAIDGNARRVLSRYFTLESAKPSVLQSLAAQLLDPDRCGDFNQAVMELGATVCTPVRPKCDICPLESLCAARAEGEPERYPAKKSKRPVPHFDIATGVVLNDAGRLLIQRRAEEALLGGLWELPGGKRKSEETLEEACHRELKEELGITVSVDGLLKSVKHAYTHFRITLYAFRCTITDGTPQSTAGLPVRWVALNELHQYAFPRANRHILDALANLEPSVRNG